MSTRFAFWTHGIATVIGDPNRTEEVQRTPEGSMKVRQRVGDGWFAIPITRPVNVGGKYAVLDHVRLRCRLKNASIDAVEFRRGHMPIMKHAFSAPDNPPLTGSVNKPIFCDKERQAHASIILWVHVTFEDPIGEITFFDTGAAYFY
jgi:hypothetical protein